ncbi:MAG: DUF3426 domain-containing protein [Gammaproteobacteria bacterium]
MYTKCPECRAVFRVTTEQLQMAEGLVRCGICDSVFNGGEHIEEDHDPNAVTDNWRSELDQDDNDDPWPDEITGDVFNSDISDVEQQKDDDALTAAERVPTVIRDDFGSNILSKTNSPIQITVFTLGAIALAIFFLGQISYWQNVDVLPRTWVNSFCNIVGCGENNKRDIAAIKMLNRNIYTHPNVKDALMITTSFVNQSPSAQAYPLLAITLLDTQGQIVAVRRFSPKDYLVNKSLADTLMPSNQPIGARLEVLDPGNKVIAYEFEFH